MTDRADRLDWAVEGRDWPHREASHFVDAAGLRWHVQRFSGPHSTAPLALLLHGTGASAHSWHPMLPLLRQHFELLALDLPGHAFTSMPSAAQFTPSGMARAVSALLKVLGVAPALIVGHSAGAAVGARMALDGLVTPKLIVSLNGAFLPLPGVAGWVFPPVAKLMAAMPFTSEMVSRRAADRGAVERLVNGTGSRLDAASTDLYARLVRNPGHVAGSLGMMANWDVRTLWLDLPRLAPWLALVVADNDRAVPPSQGRQLLARMTPPARATLVNLPRLGHLAHEEDPASSAAACIDSARAAGVLDKV